MGLYYLSNTGVGGAQGGARGIYYPQNTGGRGASPRVSWLRAKDRARVQVIHQ